VERKTRVVVADDHPLVAAGLRQILESDGSFEVVGVAHSGPEVLPLVRRTDAGLVLLDLRMPGADGLVNLERITNSLPGVKVIIVSATSDPETVQACFKRGAFGFIVKSIDLSDVCSAIRASIYGTAFCAQGLPAMNEDTAASEAGLTEREIDILRAIAEGKTNKQIGEELWVTEQTVKFHLTNVFRKLEVKNRTEASAWAFSHGMLRAES